AHPPGPGGGGHGGARTRTPRPRGRSSTFHSTCCFASATGSSPARVSGGRWRRGGLGALAGWRTKAGRAVPGRPERPRANSASRLPRLRSPAPRPGRCKHSGAELDVSGKPGPLSLSFCGRRARTQAPADPRGQLHSARSPGPRSSTMLDPSSSEEESDEGLEEESREVLVAPGGSQRAPPATAREGRRDVPGRSGGGGCGAARPVSPSPSVLSEGRDEPERQLDEEQERRIRLQLYVFVVRCIAYPFNAKQPTDMARRQQK
ncbi:calcium-dependent secretion activator 2 isoform X12, partial [Sigmodon hispidus]